MRIRYSTLTNGRPVKRAVVYTREEHGINFADVDRDAVHIVESLRASGYETYIVGGAVRDLILKRKPKDFDIVSAASPARIKRIFRNARIIGRRFRLVHVCFGPRIFEVSTFRSLKDGTTSNTFGTIEEDVLRRDFSLNALFYDPLKQEVIDYVGGMKDIREKCIRPVIPLKVIFTDDPVRMIRAVKYAAASGFRLPLFLRWQIKRQSALLAPVSPSRLTEEIMKIVNAPASAGIVESLEAHGLYSYLQPNASRLMRGAAFRARYLGSFAALQEKPEVPGWNLTALIRDYLEDYLDWEAGANENYRNAFIAARQFVLPMNPPRVELDRAVRILFSEHGITVKKARHFKRGEIIFPGAEEPEKSTVPPERPPSAEAVAPRKRRRRPRRNKGRGTSNREQRPPEQGE